MTYLVCACTGDPVEMVLLALQAAEKVFGVDTNKKGYKVPRGCGVIQGDGINIEVLEDILQSVLAHGYSAQVCLSLVIVVTDCSTQALFHAIHVRLTYDIAPY